MSFDLFIPMNHKNARSRPSWWAGIANTASKTIIDKNARMIVARNPVKVTAEFVLPCPLNHRLEEPHLTGPSVLGLGQTLSALEKVMIAREEQIVEVRIRKRYGVGYSVGATVEVDEL